MKISIIEQVTLTAAEVKAAQDLIKEVHQFDQSVEDPYLSNRYNYFAQMPAFVLAYDKEKLIGLVMLYADEKPDAEVELHVMVAPTYRHHGIASKMLEHALAISKLYGYQKYSFVSEKVFLQKNVDFLNNTNLIIDDTEYFMKAYPNDVDLTPAETNHGLTVRAMTNSDIDKVAVIYSAAFAEPMATTNNYLVQGLKDTDEQSFVLLYQGEIVGYCGVDFSQVAYFFGLLIAEKYRGRGFATFFIKQMMRILQEQGTNVFSLAVDCNNSAAIKVYKKAGFVTKTEVAYLVKNE